MEQIIQLNSGAKLSPHFTLGELTRTSHNVYNIPSHEAIENLKRVCTWLEYLRKRYNEFLDKPSGKAERNQTTPGHSSLFEEGRTGGRELPSSWETARLEGALATEGTQDRQGVEERALLPIIINSGYRSPQLNRKVGGSPTSNHLTGCAVDIRVSGIEQALRYAVILLDYADESKQDFDELLLEKRSASPLGSSKNQHGAIWLHFAVRPKDNRRKILFINA